jgi:hypothetical protein
VKIAASPKNIQADESGMSMYLDFERGEHGLVLNVEASSFGAIEQVASVREAPDGRTWIDPLQASVTRKIEKRDFKGCDFVMDGLVPRLLHSRPSEDERMPGAFDVPRQLNRFLNWVRFENQRNLRGIRHVGPLRQVPQRLESLGAQQSRLASDAENLSDYLGGSTQTQEFISRWIHTLTDGDYFVRQVDMLSSDLPFLGNHTSLVLMDVHKQTSVSLMDAGVGLSQVLPILTQLAPVNPRERRGRTVLIEQPELHLHPRMQSDLADLLIEAVDRRNGLQVIAETHSESIVLRIQRRIREGRIRAEEVQVLYCDRLGDAGNVVTPLPMDDNGMFLEAWPSSFVDSRLDDVLDTL